TTRVAAQAGVVAERAMYFSYGGGDGGHVSLGAAHPSLRWHFAEGSTSGFDTFYAVGNPNATAAAVTVLVRTGGGQVVTRQPGLDRTEFASLVEAAAPVVAERVTYFRYPTPFYDPAVLGHRLLSEGMTGNDVYETQRRMTQLGFDVGDIDGTFSDTMTDASIA